MYVWCNSGHLEQRFQNYYWQNMNHIYTRKSNFLTHSMLEKTVFLFDFYAIKVVIDNFSKTFFLCWQNYVFLIGNHRVISHSMTGLKQFRTAPIINNKTDQIRQLYVLNYVCCSCSSVSHTRAQLMSHLVQPCCSKRKVECCSMQWPTRVRFGT